MIQVRVGIDRNSSCVLKAMDSCVLKAMEPFLCFNLFYLYTYDFYCVELLTLTQVTNLWRFIGLQCF